MFVVRYMPCSQEMTVISLILLMVVFPAVIGFCLYSDYQSEDPGDPGSPRTFSLRTRLGRFFRAQFQPGDFLIYRKSKASPHPGPRARNVQAAEHGDDYYYEVDKFWAVSDVLEDGRLVAVTRTGKQVYLTPADERLRKARWLERKRYRQRFPAVH